MNKPLIAVWFSCGVASAVAAKKTVELLNNDYDIRILNNPVIEEHKDNLRFLKDVQDWIGKKIEFISNPKYPSNSAYEVWEKRKYMSGIGGAPCTLELKKRARQHWEQTNKADIHVLGFTYDEIKRHKKFILTERENTLPVLINLKLTKQDCFDILKKEKIRIPDIYNYGFPNANCIGCVKSASPDYWNLVKKHFPEVFRERESQSEKIKCRLIKYKGERLYLSQLTDEMKTGRIKSWDCGIFCEEK